MSKYADRMHAEPQVALAYQAKERELLVKEAAIYRIFVYDGQARECCLCLPPSCHCRDSPPHTSQSMSCVAFVLHVVLSA